MSRSLVRPLCSKTIQFASIANGAADAMRFDCIVKQLCGLSAAATSFAIDDWAIVAARLEAAIVSLKAAASFRFVIALACRKPRRRGWFRSSPSSVSTA